MRIAHLTTIDMSLALLLGTELATDVAEGHDVFAISAPGRYRELIDATGATFVAIPNLTRTWSPSQDLRAFVGLVRTLKRLELDVLHTHTPKPGVLGRVAGRMVGVPVVVNTCHGLWAGPQDSLPRRAFVYASEAFASLFSDYEFFQNANDAQTLRRVLRPGRYAVVGNGIDLEYFLRDTDRRRRVRQEWGIGDDELLVGAVGRRVAEKGLAEFAEMARSLQDRARFIWVGPEDGPTGVEPDDAPITFVGERSDMRDVYSAFDIFALPTYREGFSRAGMEAAACGLPMVLTDIRGCREIGDNGRHILLVPPHDAPALTDAVRRLIDDPSLRSRLARAACDRAHTTFDQRAIAERSLRTYAEILEKRGRSGEPERTVLHVIPHESRRGAQVFASNLRHELRSLPGQRHQLLAIFDGPESGSDPDVRLGVRSGRARRLGLDPLAVLAVRRHLRRHRPAVVIAHGGEPLKYLALTGTRAPIAYYKVGLSTDEISRPGHAAFYRQLVQRVRAAVAVSGAVADQLRTRLGVPDDLVQIIPNGRDPRTFHPGSPSPGTPPQLVWVGQLEAGKRPELFLDVVERLRADGLEFRAVIAGDGPLRQDLEERARTSGVTLLGVCRDVPTLLRESSALVMTSAVDTEGMPGVVVEAGLSGIPVVSTRAAGVADVVLEGQTGFLADDSQELAKFVAYLINSPQERTRMGAAARDRCVTSFSIEHSGRLWAELIDRLAPTRDRGAS